MFNCCFGDRRNYNYKNKINDYNKDSNKNYMNNPEYYTDLDDLHEFYFNKKNMYIQKFYPQEFGINEQAKVK